MYHCAVVPGDSNTTLPVTRQLSVFELGKRIDARRMETTRDSNHLSVEAHTINKREDIHKEKKSSSVRLHGGATDNPVRRHKQGNFTQPISLFRSLLFPSDWFCCHEYLPGYPQFQYLLLNQKGVLGRLLIGAEAEYYATLCHTAAWMRFASVPVR